MRAPGTRGVRMGCLPVGRYPPAFYIAPYRGGRRTSHVGKHRPRPWSFQSAHCVMPSRRSRWSAAPTPAFGAGGAYQARCLSRPGSGATSPRYLRGKMGRESRPFTSSFLRGTRS